MWKLSLSTRTVGSFPDFLALIKFGRKRRVRHGSLYLSTPPLHTLLLLLPHRSIAFLLAWWMVTVVAVGFDWSYFPLLSSIRSYFPLGNQRDTMSSGSRATDIHLVMSPTVGSLMRDDHQSPLRLMSCRWVQHHAAVVRNTVPEHGMTVSMPELTNNISIPFNIPNHAHCPCLPGLLKPAWQRLPTLWPCSTDLAHQLIIPGTLSLPRRGSSAYTTAAPATTADPVSTGPM